MTDHCTKCQAEVLDRGGYETPDGKALCGSCYFAVWGVTGAAEIARAVELLTPEPVAPRRTWPR